jgi:hypothetical protein
MVVDVTVVAMWAHPRSMSTAFERMMMERGDITVVHEPLVTLTDFGEVPLPTPEGGTVVARSTYEVLSALKALSSVFFKDTLEYRYEYLFAHPEEIAAIQHTFIVREPARTIASHFAMKPEVACHEIGYEHQWDLFELAWRVTGQRPVVIQAERILASPAAAVAAYCEAVGLPNIPAALTWRPGHRTEWERTQRWHLDAANSSGFHVPEKQYEITVNNNETLRAYFAYHRRYYDRLVEHALDVEQPVEAEHAVEGEPT